MSKWAKDFPILHQKIHGHSLAYLDSSASTQRPQRVIDAINHYETHDHANIHRGVYTLSERATLAYESARKKVQKFLNAEHAHEIIFTRGTTESINLVAHSFGRLSVKAGDEIIISAMEHHSNIVPWQILCEEKGAKLKIIPIDDQGELDLTAYRALLNSKTKLVAIIHVSNVLGTVNPIQQMIRDAHAQNIPVLVDGAQAVAHQVVDVRELDCDFYTFSSHKIYGPTGVGVLYGKTKWLEAMPPYQAGGDMISRVSFSKTEYNVLPHKFEAGTPNISGVIGLGAAFDYVQSIGINNIITHEQELSAYALAQLSGVPGLRLIGNPKERIGVFSFVMKDAHAHDVGTILDFSGIAVRTGHHCAMPLMERYHLSATVRASLGIYNCKADIDCLIQGLEKVAQVMTPDVVPSTP